MAQNINQWFHVTRQLSNAGKFKDVADRFQSGNVNQVLSNQPAAVLIQILDQFDLQEYSLVQLFLLKITLQKNQIDQWEEVFNRTRTFLLNFNSEQVRKSPGTLVSLSQFLVMELLQRKTPMIGIHPLLRALKKFNENEKCLTNVHSDVCQLALVSKCFNPVVKILDVTYTDIAKHAADNPEKILQFFYYGGMIYASLKQYERALYYFETCVTMPASAVSYIMLESYKKFILISLLIHGDKTKDDCLILPKYTSDVIEKYFKHLCKPYHELANAFYSNKNDELNAVIGKNYDVFEADVNTGLVVQVAAAQTKSNIKRLTKTFVTLSLGDVATKAGVDSPQDAKEKIVAMIQERSIHAKISEKDGMVQFLGNPGQFNSSKELARLEERVDAIISSNKQVQKLEEEIILSHKYIQKTNTRSDDIITSNGFGLDGSLEYEDHGEYRFEEATESVTSKSKGASSISSSSPSSSTLVSKHGSSTFKQGSEASQSTVSSSNMNES